MHIINKLDLKVVASFFLAKKIRSKKKLDLNNREIDLLEENQIFI
jgi:hypothetical protein